VTLQIIAKGFQTFGDDYKIDKDQLAIEIRMKRPGEQYSIYKPHPEKSEAARVRMRISRRHRLRERLRRQRTSLLLNRMRSPAQASPSRSNRGRACG